MGSSVTKSVAKAVNRIAFSQPLRPEIAAATIPPHKPPISPGNIPNKFGVSNPIYSCLTRSQTTIVVTRPAVPEKSNCAIFVLMAPNDKLWGASRIAAKRPTRALCWAQMLPIEKPFHKLLCDLWIDFLYNLCNRPKTLCGRYGGKSATQEIGIPFSLR